MNLKIVAIFLCATCFSSFANCQTLLKIYHGANGETQVYNGKNEVVVKPKLKLKQGDFVSIQVINANPLLYKYSLKYENLVIESEDKAITDLLTTFGTILSSRAGDAAFTGKTSETDMYKSKIDGLIKDINNAKKIIQNSDKPETPNEALSFSRTQGLRDAIYKINAISNAQYRFNNSNLLKDLNDLSEKAAVDDVEKEAFALLNSSLVEKVNEIKKKANATSTQTIWKNEFRVSDTSVKIVLAISKIDKENKNLIRDGGSENEFQLELGSILPLFKRATLELVPVANFIFSQNVREFYLENNIIQNRLKPQTSVTAGVILNINFARFGEFKEMAVGIGPGYKLSTAGDALENFFLSTLFSYKSFIRVGVGFGFAQFPTETLKGGAKVGEPLNANISNLSDLVQFQEKPSAFITISFTGLNLTKKK